MAEPSTAYNSANFDSGNWGTVKCPAGNNVAWLKCEQFDACKIWSTVQGIYVDRSYWGVQGWEVTVESSTYGVCFVAAPSHSDPNEIHHIVFANNVANGCRGGGISTYNDGNAGVDYVAFVGNIAYNAAQGSAECASGISVFQPIQYDSAPGTHIFVAGNFSWHTDQGDPCGGVVPYGGDGIILDSFDGSRTHLAKPYGAQAVAENNISVGNGGLGIEVQNNVAGSDHAPIYVMHNTVWGNEKMSSMQSNVLCSEMIINSGYNVHEYDNLAAVDGTRACHNNLLYAFRAYSVDGTDAVYSNFLYGEDGQSEGKSSVTNKGTFEYAGSNVVGKNPKFKNATAPPAPYCSGTANVTSCMSKVIADFTPTNSAASGYGYQRPSTTAHYDPLFPQWLCNTNLPPGLVTMGCKTGTLPTIAEGQAGLPLQ